MKTRIRVVMEATVDLPQYPGDDVPAARQNVGDLVRTFYLSRLEDACRIEANRAKDPPGIQDALRRSNKAAIILSAALCESMAIEIEPLPKE